MGQPGFVSGRAVRAISRAAGKLDIYATAADGHISGAAWEPGLAGDAGMPDGWRGWWHLQSGSAPAGATVTAASRAPDHVDLFVVSDNGVVYTAAWSPAGWVAWRPLEGITVPAGAAVECTSRSRDKLDVFVIDNQGRVQTSAWEPKFGERWSPWRQVGGGTGVPGAPVSVVSRAPDHLDVYLTGLDGVVRTSEWNPSLGDTWADWQQVANGATVPGARVSVASRQAHHLDVFVCDAAGQVQTSAWNPGMGGAWADWRVVAGGAAVPGAPVGVVSRSTDHLDVFVADARGRIQTSAWEPSLGTEWAAWRQIGVVETAPGGEVHGVSKQADHIDIFVTGVDGHVHTASWEPSFGTTWHGWSPIG
jgi:hypothetical protein